jgi:signal transduction histidine kinase
MVNRHTHFSGTRWIHLWLQLKQVLISSSENEKRDYTFTNVEQLAGYQADMQQFFYHTSHNLKGPITRLNGLIELLLMDKSAEGNQQYLSKIDREVKQMNKMLSKLQTINEIAGLEVHDHKCSLGQVIDSVLSRYQNRISEKNIYVQINTDEDYELDCHEKMLFWMLDNLVENAIIFSQSDEETQSYLKININKQADQLLISVEDNGVGIRAEAYEQIFELFYRDSPLSEGVGAGLYIVRECAKRMHGKISVASKPACYTRFDISVPHQAVNNVKVDIKQTFTTYKV